VPQSPELVNLVNEDGTAVAVPIEQAASLIERGYRPETQDQAAGRLAQTAREEIYGGTSGAIAATGLGILRGGSMGTSDVLLSGLGLEDDLQGFQEINPGYSTAGEIGGAIAASFAAPQSLLARTPVGLAARAGSRIARLGEGGGAVARAGYSAAGAAVEGGLQGAGAYVSDVALGNRELSADGVMGAMGQGALWGGVAGGSLSVAGDGLIAARRLFPKQEMTRGAVDAAETIAKQEIAGAVQDGEVLADHARNRLREIRAQRAAMDIEVKTKLDDIAVRKAQEIAALDIRAAQAKAQTAEAKLEKAKAPAVKGKRTRKALQEEGASAPGATEGDSLAPGASVSTAVEPDSTATALEKQLLGTKQAIDAGQSLSDIQGTPSVANRTTHIEDALNAELARIDPEAAKLVNGLNELEQSKGALDQWLGKYQSGSVAKFERGQAARDWADSVRPKEAGYYTKLAPDSQNPGMTEGGIGLARGRTSVFRGSEEQRALADARTMSKLSPEEQLAADMAIEEQAARRSKRIAKGATEATEPAETVQSKVDSALKSKVDSIDDDIAETAQAINRMEAAHADVAEALGPIAPTGSQARAQAFREAQKNADMGAAKATAQTAEEIERAANVVRLGGDPSSAPGLSALLGKGKGVVGVTQDVATAAEALRMMGIDVPDPKNIPVIGPLLSMYLKARVLGKAFGRFGGKVAETAEGTIARKAAATRERIYAAVDKMLDVSGKALKATAPQIGGPAAALAHTLFSDDKPKAKPYTSAGQQGTIAEHYLARSAELGQAMQPGAIARAVKQRVRTSDPAVVDAIVAAQERKLQFLDSKRPKPAEPPILTQIRMPWVPSKPEIMQWGRYIEAAEDPAGVMERAANGGHVSIEAVETLKAVYPTLYQEAQKRILERAVDTTEPIPYARRVQLSIMFDMPMDGSQTPEGAAFLQSTYAPPAPTPQPQAPQQTPTVTSNVRMSERTSPEG
jgi:hypothetical protein